jgi:hypothetical protein
MARGPLFSSRKHAPHGRHQIGRLMKRYCILAGSASACLEAFLHHARGQAARRAM